jgi:hypothetical protein
VTVRFPAVLAAVAAGFLVAGCSSSSDGSKASSSTSRAAPATAKGAATTGSCTADDATLVCTLPTDGNYIDLDALLTEATAVDDQVSSSTTMVIAAVGGTGGNPGPTGTQDQASTPGSAGVAQTVTTIADYKTAYGTSDFYYYLGYNGTGDQEHGAAGGAATIVSSQDLNQHSICIATYSSCGTTNVVLLAGGGGGAGEWGLSCSGGHGGAGGTAVSTTESPATGAGSSGDSGHCGGADGGGGGNEGKAGAGGDGPSGASDNHAGKYGADGVGGAGGPYHTSSGPGDVMIWMNGSSTAQAGTMSGVGQSAGVGGEGEWRGTTGKDYGPGGGGGGGFGGGGGGGGGGYDFAGGGGGGGGSWAAPAAVFTTTMPTQTATTSAQVTITFYP